MGQLANEAAAIKTVLETVPNAGVVFDHQPMPKNDWASFIDTFTVDIAGTRQIRAWTIQYVGEQRVDFKIAQTAAKVNREIEWLVRFQMSWAGDSETTFRDLVEVAVQTLDTNRSLSGLVLDKDPADVELPNDGAGIMLADTLCHYAEITFRTRSEETLTVT